MNNFSLVDVGQIVYMIGSKFNVRVNKCGNICVTPITNNNPKNEFWTLGKINGNYIWRRHAGGFSHPMHQVNRKRIGHIVKDVYNGKTYYWCNRSWDIRNCEFKTFDEAVNYFVDYLKKYKKY